MSVLSLAKQSGLVALEQVHQNCLQLESGYTKSWLPSLSNNMKSPNPYDNMQEKMRLKAEIRETRDRITRLGSVGQVRERA